MHMSKVRVAVAGASGYAGGEVLRLLLGHPLIVGSDGLRQRRSASLLPGQPRRIRPLILLACGRNLGLVPGLSP